MAADGQGGAVPAGGAGVVGGRGGEGDGGDVAAVDVEVSKTLMLAWTFCSAFEGLGEVVITVKLSSLPVAAGRWAPGAVVACEAARAMGVVALQPMAASTSTRAKAPVRRSGEREATRWWERDRRGRRA
jgi:hypothetical protein